MCKLFFKIDSIVDFQKYLDGFLIHINDTKLDIIRLAVRQARAFCRLIDDALVLANAAQNRAVIVEVHIKASDVPIHIIRLEAKVEAVPAARDVARPRVLEAENRVLERFLVVAAERITAAVCCDTAVCKAQRRAPACRFPVGRIRQHIRHVDHVVGGFGIGLRNDDLAGLFNGRGCVIARTKVEVARGVCQHGIGIDLIEPFLAVYLEHHAQLVGRNLAEAERHVIGLAVFQREIALGNCAVVRVTLCIEHRLVRLKGNHHAAGLVP